MPTPPDPYEVAATGLKSIIEEEFTAEGFKPVHDKLHPSLGRTRVDIGISPIRQTLLAGNEVVQNIYILVQFYDLWDEKIDPNTSVNPFKITGYANRFQRKLEQSQASFSGSPEVWYYGVESISYPDDPTGNKTRFEATLKTYGDNTALVETR